jgi:hypothetical protein
MASGGPDADDGKPASAGSAVDGDRDDAGKANKPTDGAAADDKPADDKPAVAKAAAADDKPAVATADDKPVVAKPPAGEPPPPRGEWLTRIATLARRGKAVVSRQGSAVLAAFDRAAVTLWFRCAVSALIIAVHLLLFLHAAHARLDIPFDTDPHAEITFTDPNFPSLGNIPREPHHWSRLILSRFDAQHYIEHEVRGLSSCPKTKTGDRNVDGHRYLDCGLGWLPAYGVVARIVAKLTGAEADYALVFLSLLCTMVLNLCFTSKPLRDRIGTREAYLVLIAFHFYPTAFYLVTPFTEAAVVMLGIGGLAALCRERWVLAGILVGASTALRMPCAAYTFGLIVALLVAAAQRWRARTPGWWKPLLGLIFSGWGQVATWIWLQLAVGNWHAFFEARYAFGDHNRMAENLQLNWLLHGFAGQAYDMVVLLGLLGIMALTWRDVLARFKAPESAFLVVSSLATAFMSLIAPLHWWGITRYMLLCPLAFFGMGVMARKHRTLFVLWLIFSALLYWNVEMCQYISQGDPRVCPCRGPANELTMSWRS